MQVDWLGRMPFEDALRLQEEAVADPLRRERLLLLEHEPVYTTGRGGALANLPDARQDGPGGSAIPVVRIGRGGDATYHGPGQLVGYPIVDLRARGGDVHRFLRVLEEAVIAIVQEFGRAGERRAGLTGVWVHLPAEVPDAAAPEWTGREGSRGPSGGARAGRLGKIASIGIGVRRGMSLHGFALNVSVDLSAFAAIVPCGIPDVEMTSLAVLGVHPVPPVERVAAVATRVVPAAIDAALPRLDGSRGSR